MSTIAAISTPFGRGGIATIRISGENALDVADRMFCTAGGRSIKEIEGGRAVYGDIISDGKRIDDGIATVFRAPRSFTGEDVVEISCHGGILLTERVLKTAFDCGAIQAGAGEFSQRAFLNGKLSLSEAEAVIGLIDAENEEKLRLSASHTNGILKKRCDGIHAELLHLLSSVYVKLDYPEEDLAEVSDSEFREKLAEIYSSLDSLCSTYRHGKAVSEGVKATLIGKPNAGKSSLLNALLGEQRAIVTDIAGTTRDVIEEKVSAGRIILRLFDTAGIRESDDEVEKIGIGLALDKARQAEIIIAVFDAAGAFEAQDEAVLKLCLELLVDGKSVIFAINKSDKPFACEGLADRLASVCKENKRAVAITVSAKNGTGIQDIKNAAEAFFCERDIDYSGEAVLANARQFSAAETAKNAVGRAIEAFDACFSADVCGLDLEAALAAIGQVDGRSVSGEITDAIFHNFCVGK